MSVVIRLAKVGKRGIRAYRIVAIAKTEKRDSAPLEILGSYIVNEKPIIDEKRVAHWQSMGAAISIAVSNLLTKKEHV